MRKYIGLIGRRSELKLLNNLYQNVADTFILMTGIDHVGKSTLARYFSKDKPTLNFSAKEVCDELSRRDFCTHLYHHYHQPVPDMKNGAPDWKELFEIYAETEEEGRKILILDNVELLIRAEPNFQKILKNAWEKTLRPHGVMLIAIIRTGSVLLNMEKSDSVLLKGAGMRLNIEPIPFIAMLRDYPHRSFEELVSLYAITGGIPMYWHFFANTPALVDQLGVVREQMLTHTGWFYDEPISQLNTEVYEPIEYVSVLQAIANGYMEINEIANYLKFKSKTVAELLENLESLGFVRSENPVTEKRPNKNKARYLIAQPFFDFWFTFVFPKRQELQLGHTLPAYEMILKNFDAYAEYWFSQISRDVFLASLKQKSYNFNCDKIGSYWNKKGNIVDVMALDNTQKKIFFGECIYADATPTLVEFEDFMRECESLDDLGRYRSYSPVYGLFTIKRPERDLINYALEHDNVMIFEGTTLYRKKQPGFGLPVNLIREGQEQEEDSND